MSSINQVQQDLLSRMQQLAEVAGSPAIKPASQPAADAGGLFMAVMRSVETGVLESQLPLAPQREGPALRPVPRPTAPTDWAPRSGAYPIRLLKVLRRGSSLRRKLFQRKIPE